MSVPKLRFPEFEGEWEEQRLGHIAQLTSSKRVYLSDYVESGVPFFRGKEISELERGVVPDDILYISTEAFERFRDKFGAPKAGDILITAVGTLANIFRVRVGQEFYFKDGNLIWLREINASSSFLEISLKFNRPAILRSAIGSSQKALTIVELNKLKFSFPSLPEQKKIAAFLGVVDAKIAALRERRAGLERYKRGLMQALFSQTLRFTKPCGSAFPDWESLPFSEVAELSKTRLNPVSSSEKPPLVELENLESGLGSVVGLSDLEGQLSQKTRFQSGDVLFGKLRPYLRKFARPDFDGVCSSEIWVMRGKAVSNEFLFTLIQGNQFNQLANISAGSKMPRSDWKTIADSEFDIPHPDEQAKIAEALSAMDTKIAAVGDQVTSMEAFKKGLLQQMFV